MKAITIFISTIFCVSNGLSQDCNTQKIQSAVVEKPTQGQAFPNATCDAITITWKGSEHQTYTVTATYTDVVTGKTVPAQAGSPITCDKEFNCSATLPLKPGSTLSWTIQAVQTVDGRAFYSYPLHGESAGCDQGSLVETGSTTRLKTAITSDNKNQLTVHPNPVTGELIINWAGEYRGAANLAIIDASGRPVRVMDIRKEQFDYSNRLTVQSFTAGLYFIHITMMNGRSVSTRFIKN
jgi:hypothetical protein